MRDTLKIDEVRGEGDDYQRLAIVRDFTAEDVAMRHERVVQLTVGFSSLLVPVRELHKMLDDLDAAFKRGEGKRLTLDQIAEYITEGLRGGGE